MMKSIRSSAARLSVAIGLAFGVAGAAQAQSINGDFQVAFPSTFPIGFMVPNDASLGKPVLGFGGYVQPGAKTAKTPVIFLHGNGATPDGQGCRISATNMRQMAIWFANNGYAHNELWALGYLGDQCDLGTQEVVNGQVTAQVITPTHASRTHAANLPDLRAFLANVLAYTGAAQVDIVAHGMGATLVRELVRQDNVRRTVQVRRFVSIEAPNQGIAMCAPAHLAANPYAGFGGGYTPDSPLCNEIGSPDTPFLQTLNHPPPVIDPKLTLVIRNGDSSYPYLPWADGLKQGVSPSLDKWGTPTDFTRSPGIRRAMEVILYGQHNWGNAYNAHEGIANSPDTWWHTLTFLTKP